MILYYTISKLSSKYKSAGFLKKEDEFVIQYSSRQAKIIHAAFNISLIHKEMHSEQQRSRKDEEKKKKHEKHENRNPRHAVVCFFRKERRGKRLQSQIKMSA
jgi:hypothetical protein